MDLNKAKEQAENLVLQLRELVGSLRKSTPKEERETQKEQLKVIGNSIAHLETKNVPVPDDLLKLKSKLEGDIQEGERYQVLLYFLKEQLSHVLADIGKEARKAAQPGGPQKQAS